MTQKFRMIVYLIFCLCSAAVCHAVVNGTDLTQSELQKGGIANSVVAVVVTPDSDSEVDSNQAYICTGTLIQPRIVLTAGHCLNHGQAANRVHIHFQNLNIRQQQSAIATTMDAINFIVNTNYLQSVTDSNESMFEDLAEILLPSPAPNSVQPATLPLANFSFQSNNEVTSVGYGLSNDVSGKTQDGSTAGVLRRVQFNTISFFVFPDLGAFESRSGMYLLIHADVSSLCEGDSGGPLFLQTPGKNPTLIGVAEGTSPPDEKTGHICLGGANQFINVAKSLDFIQDTANKLLSGPK